LQTHSLLSLERRSRIILLLLGGRNKPEPGLLTRVAPELVSLLTVDVRWGIKEFARGFQNA